MRGERRVALTPTATSNLVKKGVKVRIEEGAGALAQFSDEEFHKAGANVVSRKEAFQSDVVLKVRVPQDSEAELFRPKSTLISFVHPAINKQIVDLLAQRQLTVFAMDCIPRISRAQVFDALSSMANVAGYKAVVEAAYHFGRFFGLFGLRFAGRDMVTATVPAAKVLVIGGGVAAQSAVATARKWGAIVRGLDTRPAGYDKQFFPKFYEAENGLFTKQCREADIIISTALIPGKKAPVLITKEMVASMKPGSVVVDLAAEADGNVETTRPGELYVDSNGVTHIGYTDFPSRLPTQSSTLYANNITKFLMSIGDKESFFINLNDEVVRGSIVLQEGKLLWSPPLPPKHPPPTPAQSDKPAVATAVVEEGSQWIADASNGSTSEESPEVVPPNESGVVLLNINEAVLQKLSALEGIPFLSKAKFRSPALPVNGLLYRNHLMVSLVCRAAHTTVAPPLHVWFLINTGSPGTYLSKTTIDALAKFDGIPSAVYVAIQDPQFLVPCDLSPLDSHFHDINLLGMQTLLDMKVSIEINRDKRTFRLVRQ